MIEQLHTTTAGRTAALVLWLQSGAFVLPGRDEVTAFQPVSPTLDTRQRLRTPEISLLHAILTNALERCEHLAGMLAELARGAWRSDGRSTPRKVLREAAELRAWLGSDSHELHSLGWVCDWLTTSSGEHWCPKAVGEALLRVLDGRANQARPHRRMNGGTDVRARITTARYNPGKTRVRRAA